MKNLIALTSLVLFTACAQEGPRPLSVGIPSSVAPLIPAVDPNQAAINQEIAEYNANRAAQGQDLVSPGLTCALWTVRNNTNSISSASLKNAVGSFSYGGNFNIPNQPNSNGLPILPLVLQPVIQNWYVLKCYGVIVATTSAWHSFDLISDDGANLYVDGLLINNDGLHSVTTKSAVKFLSTGIHGFEVDYLQGGGYEALTINMDGAVAPSNVLFH